MRPSDAITRVDAPHALPQNGRDLPGDPQLELLHAIAGHDSQLAAQQLRGQALELSAIFRQRQQTLEQRESELNARTALLENDLRVARLKSYQADPPRVCTQDEDEQDERVVAGAAVASDSKSVNLTGGSTLKQGVPHATPKKQNEDDVTCAVNEPESSELNTQYEHLEKQRQILRQREDKLDRRQRRVSEMHDEITELHREALELRLASEQVWADLTEEFPTEDVASAIAQIRAKLADHYRLANDALACRKDELHESRSDLNLQEQRLRQQRRDIQMWADRRYDEIESRLAKIILRERELDQIESDFHGQSLQWQQQREDYRHEIEQLSGQLHERSA